jgi:hypothetical protein
MKKMKKENDKRKRLKERVKKRKRERERSRKEGWEDNRSRKKSLPGFLGGQPFRNRRLALTSRPIAGRRIRKRIIDARSLRLIRKNDPSSFKYSRDQHPWSKKVEKSA